MLARRACPLVAIALLLPFAACKTTPDGAIAAAAPGRVHYVEVVCEDVAMQCATFEALHGVTFGGPVADLGRARVAALKDGTLLGVREPMAEHEQPVVRIYQQVDDIVAATKTAERNGGILAYGPTRQGETGTWAIYFQGEVQIGLWQK